MEVPSGRYANWTQDSKELVRDRWAQGFSARQIAVELRETHGLFVTRNAVVGITYRNGYTHPTKVVSEAPQSEQRRAPKPSLEFPTPILEPVEFEPSPKPPEFLGIALLDLANDQCRFPRGESPYLFCGQPRQPDSSYCASCHRLSRIPTRLFSQAEIERRARAYHNRTGAAA